MADPNAAIIQGVPTEIVQSGLLQRVFHDTLIATFIYRAEATPEKAAANIGASLTMTRPGPIAVNVTPVTGKDISPATYQFEQWNVFYDQYGNSVDTDMLTSELTLASTYLRNAKMLGINAAETLNHLARNALYTAYLAGNTCMTAAATSATAIHVAAINGFTTVTVLVSGKPLPVPVSSTNKLPIQINPGSSPTSVNVINAVPDDSSVPLGPGTLYLDAAVTASARAAVYASSRSRVLRPNAANSVDGITSSSTLTSAMLFTALKYLQTLNVPPCVDGTYHVHLQPDAIAQLVSNDANFRQLYQSLPDTTVFRDGALGQLFGMRFYQDTQNPTSSNSGTLISTGSGESKFATEINGEVINDGGVQIARVLILGGQGLYEHWIDESKLLTEAGYTGKVGEFVVVNNGISLMTDRIRMILRAPLDRKQQVVSSSWTWSGGWAVPSDVLGMNSNGSQFRRAIVLEHASSSANF